ncbi:LutB/LldF family L-lactate oxidation iron-sulfur protein [Paenibacillus farraposensis]|uniref:Lactate utilization protein B n=1 Tax=Paenibacillus farraposensis TaxID=2807095 RepID=A0ABW4DEP9_9BACL|nr:LutB/LldF family L-lactate oxidation iron-sulfur protein [Paenibacillus farraposensis]MCC3381232.1 iron-sulfur cluster-binding protein [Paenibacillus farraposensis]
MGIKIGDASFHKRTEEGIQDSFMRNAVSKAQDGLRSKKLKASESLGNWEQWRSLGEAIRQHTLDNLDYYLFQLSENIAKHGGSVFFAETAEDAREYVKGIITRKNAKKVVKSKSMVTEEISLNEAIKEAGCEVLETDLAEFILQTADNERPSHIVVPSLHKDKESICKLFHEKLGYTGTSKPEELTRFARKHLREDFFQADVGITGCNFAVAESGSISIVANEGNARMVTTLPKTLVTVMGMERIVPTWEELDVLVTLLCRSAVGQKLTSYITGLTEPGGMDGPEEFHLVIVDNGRSDILGTEFQSALQCIRCAACINVCPVYRHIGGHAYGSIYPGPIGAVLTPLLGGYDDYQDLPFASSLCGACTEACPVKIPLHELLIRHRRRIAEDENRGPLSWKIAMKGFEKVANHSGLFSFATKTAPYALQPLTKDGRMIKHGIGPLKAWTHVKDLPVPPKQSFREWFEKQRKDGK